MSGTIGILLPALAAGLLILASHVPLGRHVLQRGIIFIDIALAQFATLGIVLAHILHFDSVFATQLAAFVLALLGAFTLNLSERRWPSVQEAIIGSSFVITASLVILLLAYDPHGGEHLQELLVGQILWTTWQDLWLLVAMTIPMLGIWFGFSGKHSQTGFYLLFALMVTISVQLIGIYLVFASLILPALGVLRLDGKQALYIAYLLGACGYAGGLLLSLWLDLPAGALIVCTLGLLAAISGLFGKHVQTGTSQ